VNDQPELLPLVLAHLIAAHEKASGIAAAAGAVAVVAAAPQQWLADEQMRRVSDGYARDRGGRPSVRL